MPKCSIFGAKFRHNCFFAKFCRIDRNLRVLISNMTTSFLKILAQKYWNKAFLVPNLSFFFVCKILQLDKFEGVDFKYDNIFFEILT